MPLDELLGGLVDGIGCEGCDVGAGGRGGGSGCGCCPLDLLYWLDPAQDAGERKAPVLGVIALAAVAALSLVASVGQLVGALAVMQLVAFVGVGIGLLVALAGILIGERAHPMLLLIMHGCLVLAAGFAGWPALHVAVLITAAALLFAIGWTIIR